jgi:hypothetical protein
MSNPESNSPPWEFALSSRRHLREVTREDLRCEFYGIDEVVMGSSPRALHPIESRHYPCQYRAV